MNDTTGQNQAVFLDVVTDSGTRYDVWIDESEEGEELTPESTLYVSEFCTDNLRAVSSDAQHAFIREELGGADA